MVLSPRPRGADLISPCPSGGSKESPAGGRSFRDVKRFALFLHYFINEKEFHRLNKLCVAVAVGGVETIL